MLSLVSPFSAHSYGTDPARAANSSLSSPDKSLGHITSLSDPSEAELEATEVKSQDVLDFVLRDMEGLEESDERLPTSDDAADASFVELALLEEHAPVEAKLDDDDVEEGPLRTDEELAPVTAQESLPPSEAGVETEEVQALEASGMEQSAPSTTSEANLELAAMEESHHSEGAAVSELTGEVGLRSESVDEVESLRGNNEGESSAAEAEQEVPDSEEGQSSRFTTPPRSSLPSALKSPQTRAAEAPSSPAKSVTFRSPITSPVSAELIESSPEVASEGPPSPSLTTLAERRPRVSDPVPSGSKKLPATFYIEVVPSPKQHHSPKKYGAGKARARVPNESSEDELSFATKPAKRVKEAEGGSSSRLGKGKARPPILLPSSPGGSPEVAEAQDVAEDRSSQPSASPRPLKRRASPPAKPKVRRAVVRAETEDDEDPLPPPVISPRRKILKKSKAVATVSTTPTVASGSFARNVPSAVSPTARAGGVRTRPTRTIKSAASWWQLPTAKAEPKKVLVGLSSSEEEEEEEEEEVEEKQSYEEDVEESESDSEGETVIVFPPTKKQKPSVAARKTRTKSRR